MRGNVRHDGTVFANYLASDRYEVETDHAVAGNQRRELNPKIKKKRLSNRQILKKCLANAKNKHGEVLFKDEEIDELGNKYGFADQGKPDFYL